MKYKEFKPKKIKSKKPCPMINYKSYRIYIWGIPLLPFVILADKIKENRKWCPHKAEKVINRSLPKILEYDSEGNSYYYFMDWRTPWMYEYAPFYLKAWARQFQCRIKQHLLEVYEHPMYEKIVIEDEYDGKILMFSKKPIDK